MTKYRQEGIVPSEELLANGFTFSDYKCRPSTVFYYHNKSAILLLEQGQSLPCSPQYVLYVLHLQKTAFTHSVEIQVLDCFRFQAIYLLTSKIAQKGKYFNLMFFKLSKSY